MIHLDERQVRTQKLDRLRALGIVPYAQKFNKTHSIHSLVERWNESFRDADSVIAAPRTELATAGRVILQRSFGKVVFMTLQDATGEIQIMVVRDSMSIALPGGSLHAALGEGEEMTSAHKIAEKLVDIGDFIWVKGELFRTQKGELTIFVTEMSFLAKSLRPLPDKFHGLSDDETRYRQPYLSMISDQGHYDRMVLRSRFLKALRDVYYDHGFLEIETPILGNAASGAAAQPFVTHHEDYDMDVFLRISPETALKKATVGRFERVFEIAKDFRNEGSDPSHLQEFTMVEHYAAYWSYEDNMAFIETLIAEVLRRLGLPSVFQIAGEDGEIQSVDFAQKWERIDYIGRIREVTGVDILAYAPGDEAAFREIVRAQNIVIPGIEMMALPTMVDYFYKKLVRPKILGPAFLVNYPVYMQPLARISDTDDRVVEQFQVVINGWEIVKAYGELVDPLDQKSRFELQSSMGAKWDSEAMRADDDFVTAMEYGMPPQSGLGFGIDRFLTLITGQQNLRDIIMFPLVKPLIKTQEKA